MHTSFCMFECRYRGNTAYSLIPILVRMYIYYSFVPLRAG